MSDQPCTSASTIAADLASAKAYNLSRRLALEASSETALETASETTSETVTVPKKSHLDEMNVNNFIYNELGRYY